MMGTVDVKTRPLRLAYLVDPKSEAQIREAIRLSSTLWGGPYFPIIPLHKRMPATWADKPLRRPAAKDVILGYLDAFDPDVLVQLSAAVPPFVTATGRRVIESSEIWGALEHGRPLAPKFGIGIFELLDEIFQQHFRYKPKYPVRVAVPSVPKKLGLYWASVFGEVRDGLLPILKNQFGKALDIEEPAVDPANLSEVLSREVLFPRRIAGYGLRHVGRNGFRDRGRVFFFDAAESDDIIDLWNLRALGGSVFPLPKQFKDNPKTKERLIDFLKAHHRPWPHQPDAFDFASIIRSRNSTMEEMDAYVKTLSIPDDSGKSPFNQYLSLQHWYPKIWDEWARDRDGAAPDDLYAEGEASYDITKNDDLRVRVKSSLPSYAYENVYHGEARCANDITFRIYGSDQYYAGVFPRPAGPHVMRTMGGLTSMRGEWRIDRQGLAHLVRNDWPAYVQVPIAEDLMVAWLTDLGWKVELSPPGLLAKQIYRQLDGHLAALRNEKLLGLLEHMNGGSVQRDGTPIVDGAVRPELERDLTIGEVKSRLAQAKSDHDHLVSKGVFRLGIRIKCPNCMRSSWFALPAVDDAFSCPRCLRTLPAVGTLTDGAWAYKTAGPFSVPAYAEGAYGVLLALDFFNEVRMMGLQSTPLLSFKAEAMGKPALEADFALWWHETVFGEDVAGPIFGESKTYAEFQKKDFARMRQLAETFPGAVLVFGTLREKLTPREVKEITRIAKAGRKYWKADRPVNPVLLLTGTELLNWHAPPYCWSEEQRQRFDRAHGILQIADATQQIYLGLPSWQSDWFNDVEKRRQRWMAKRAHQPDPGIKAS